MFKSRTAIFGAIIVILLVLNVGWMIWSNWGLVTLKYTNAPLQEVIDSLQKQAGIRVRTNLDPASLVTIRVIKKPFPEALEVLAGVTDSNWKLTYVVAPAKADIDNFFATWTSGTKTEDWRWIGRGGGGGGILDDGDPIDPRGNKWNVQPVDSGELQVLFQQGNILTDALFVLPTAWNPKVDPPTGALVGKLTFKVAKGLNGEAEEVFLLIGTPQAVAGTDPGQGQPPGQGQGQGQRQGGNFQPNPQMDAWRDQRTQEKLAKLPAAKRVEAQAEIDQRKAMFAEMRAMTPEQRQAKFQEMMSDPVAMEKMEEQMAKRDSRTTPEQRLKRFKRYVDRKRELNKPK